MKKTKKNLLLIISLILIVTFAYAHSGRTDSSGGHRDNKNVSGLGYYHYHCGGNPPHLHTNGYCPYSQPSYTPTYTTYTPSTTTTTQVKKTNSVTAVFPSYPVKLNNNDISSYCGDWKPLNYNGITYIPMTSDVINELGLSSSFDSTNGFNLNKAPIPDPVIIEKTQQLDPINLEKIQFLNDYIVIVCATDKTKYHKYGCPNLDLSEFWAYNTEAAISEGYTKCEKCN